MSKLILNEDHLSNVLKRDEINDFISQNSETISKVLKGEVGNPDFLGWFKVSENASDPIVMQNQALANEIRQNATDFVVVGVGGSNRSAQALIDGVGHRNTSVKIHYLGDNLSLEHLQSVLLKLKGKSFYVNIIAKDFNTLEPGITFRMLRPFMEKEFGVNYKNRVIVTGSFEDGQLFKLSQTYGFKFLEFPKEVGGRFSAFTSVSFLPMCVAGVDVLTFLKGGMEGEMLAKEENLLHNISVRYAAIRHLLSQKGFSVQNLVSFEPRLEKFSRWALQLHGETEGKCQEAILPMLTNFSEDLHAIGQYIQQGRKMIFETFLDLRFSLVRTIEKDEVEDGFDYLTDKDFSLLNQAVLEGSRDAHSGEGVPVFTFESDVLNEETLGKLMYIFMMSSYLNAVLLGVEPFDQPGVENYKTNMYKILGK